LFGSATCPNDFLALDQMHSHQLRESATAIINHRILYVGTGSDKGDGDDAPIPTAKVRAHAAMVARMKAAGSVDEVVDLQGVDLLPLTRGIMDHTLAKALRATEYNKAMVAFLAKCVEGYEHCAWLDGDVFVHRDKTPWIDDALQMHKEDPSIIWSMPRAMGGEQSRFDTRWFMYHRDGLRRVLPFKSDVDVGHHGQNPIADFYESGLFENLMHHIAPHVPSRDGAGWVVHPPPFPEGHLSAFQDLMLKCQPLILPTLIAIVEQGQENGDMAREWQVGIEDMDDAKWVAHVKHAMGQRCRHNEASQSFCRKCASMGQHALRAGALAVSA
jgi:hypothetical protein